MEPTGFTYKFRALIVLALFVGFYLFALGVAALLVILPLAGLSAGIRIPFYFAIVMFIAAGVILWSIIPRVDKFEPPGPALDVNDNSKFMSELKSVAAKMNESFPAEVYLASENSAWVAERGGVAGMGNRRIMVIGLPLLQIVTIDELKSIIAHEFGHYYGGDTSLGLLTYRTYNTILRTVENLEKRESIWSYPFIGYAKLFLRVTLSVSRQQEFVADKCAEVAYGRDFFVSALRKVYATGGAFEHYWLNEVIPVLEAGYLPPVIGGFKYFVESEIGVSAYNANLKLQMADNGREYDTHPTLKQRLTAIGVQIEETDLKQIYYDESAISMISNLHEIEEQLLTLNLGKGKVEKLTRINWPEVGEKVMMPYWQNIAKKNFAKLESKTFGDLPKLASDVKKFAFGIKYDHPVGTSEEADKWKVVNLVGSAISSYLYAHGWELEYFPGREVKFQKEDRKICPFVLFGNLVQSKIKESDILQIFNEFGLVNQKIYD